MLSVCWTGQQEVHHYAGWSIPGPRPLYAHIQEGNALVQGAELLKPARKCDVCSSLGAKPCSRCKRSYYCSSECQKSAWKKHKKTCKAPTGVAATEAELRTLHKGMALLNMCIQRNGAGDGPTSVVVEFLLPAPEC